MRTDGMPEEKVQEEMSKMKQAEMEDAKKHMLPKERERMREAHEAMVRDRYKSDDIIRQREEEMWEEYRQIKERVDRRKPLIEAETRRQEQMMKETKEILDDPHSSEEKRNYAIRRMVHDPFKDLDEHLNPDEMAELEDLKFKSESDQQAQEKIQKLLLTATERRIEKKIDEMLDRENDVLI